MAILRLRPLAEMPNRRRDAPVIDGDRAGPMLLRVMMDNFERFKAALDAYSDVLREAGHPDRGQKTFGTLLACADLMLGADLAEEMGVPMVDDLRPWGEMLATDKMSEYEDMSDNWRACLKHLLTSRVEAWRAGSRNTVGQLLDDLAREERDLESGFSCVDANKLLAQAGLHVLGKGNKVDPKSYVLCIPNESQLVAAQFRETRWIGQAGASVWKSALRQGPATVICTDKGFNRVRVNGVQERCTLVRMAAFEETVG